MKKNFTLSLVAFVIMMLTAAVMNVSAQDAGNPWHLIVLDEDSAELAAFNVETVTGVTVSGGQVQIDMTWDGNPQSFSCPAATSIFGFEPRTDGTGTANEIIENPAWSVFYNGSSLSFSEPVSAISVYTVYGALVRKFTGTYTSVPINLSQGLYIVQTQSGTAKLPVSKSRAGAGTAQTQQTPALTTRAAPAMEIPPVTPRAGTIRIYWNIRYGNSVTPVEIADVASFCFTEENTIVFTLTNGSTIEFTDYQGAEFTIEPVPTSSQWDMEKTLKFGGASYSWEMPGVIGTTIVFAIVHKNGVKFHIEQRASPNQFDPKFSMAEIAPKVWEISGRLSACPGSIWYYGMSYIDRTDGVICIDGLSTGELIAASLCSNWGFNNNTNIIPTTIVQNADGSITMSYVDYTGVKREYTFTGW
jgi:hypothetical protein